MRVIWIGLLLIMFSLNSFSQEFTWGGGYEIDYRTSCYNQYWNGFNNVSNLPSEGGLMTNGGGFENSTHTILDNINGLQLQSKSPLSHDSSPAWFQLANKNGKDCQSFFSIDRGLNMVPLRASAPISFEISSNKNNSEIFIYLGSGGELTPTTSTYNLSGSKGGDSILMSIVLPIAGVKYEVLVNFDYSKDSLWTNWSGRNNVQSIGYVSGTDSALFSIYKIKQIPAYECVYTSNTHMKNYALNSGSYSLFTDSVAANISDSVNIDYSVANGGTASSFRFQVLLSGSYSWTENLSSVNASSNGSIFSLSTFSKLHEGMRIRCITNYNTSEYENKCRDTSSTIAILTEIPTGIICSEKNTSDTSYFIVSDLAFKPLNEKVYFTNTDVIKIGNCDSIIKRYHKYKYTDNPLCLSSVEDTLHIYLSKLVTVEHSKESAHSSIKVYPNPATKTLNVGIDNYSSLKSVTINIVSGQGTTVHSSLITSSLQLVDVSSWSAGIYYLEVKNGGTLVETRKIVVNK